MQYVRGLRGLGGDVFGREQSRPPDAPAAETRLLSTFFERLRQFGLEGKALLYARDRGRGAGPDAFRFVGGDWSDAERVLRRGGLFVEFPHSVLPPLVARGPPRAALAHL